MKARIEVMGYQCDRRPRPVRSAAPSTPALRRKLASPTSCVASADGDRHTTRRAHLYRCQVTAQETGKPTEAV
ncbi:unnamed protein product [Toxocara canis]|uniref:Transposase n=1 Tax=Toxocara canis TaxID=6265 RepID=A0A183V6Z7_TOXCA|nr:unnamed protein product [Toxocara canis]